MTDEMTDEEASERARKAIRTGRILTKVKPVTWEHLKQSVTLEEVLIMADVLSRTDLEGEPRD